MSRKGKFPFRVTTVFSFEPKHFHSIYLSIVAKRLEGLLFSGANLGWASLVFVLKEMIQKLFKVKIRDFFFDP